ncbi:hypothetical protein J4422_04625 [Candidatus Pacearchaeota archaeon]|nr:hypothetical protein [Candidatus Pacearchaeota archaeon]
MTKILNQQEKKEIEASLHEQFGVEKIPGLILMRGEERLFFFSGDFSETEIKNLEACVPIERVGIYFARVIGNDVKLSIEGTNILKNQIKKNIFNLDSKQLEEWMTGSDLQVKTGKKGFLVIKYKDDFLGCGKASEEKIGNFIPKSRRLRQKG